MKSPSQLYWVLVADSGSARIFELRKAPAEFCEVHSLVSDALHKRNSDLVSDGSGRSFNTRGPSGHSKEQKSDPHDLAEQEFSRKLVEKLELAAHMGVFEKLMIIADPKTLGRLRPLMSKPLRKQITHEVNLDLVGMPQEKLKQKIKAQLGWVD